MLERNNVGGEAVEEHGAFVVGGPEGVQEDGGNSEEGEVFDVRIVRGMICYDWR